MCVGAWSRHKLPPGIAFENTLSTYVAAGAQGVNCLAENNYIIYWKYGTLSMIGMLLNNICEICNHNIIKQE